MSNGGDPSVPPENLGGDQPLDPQQTPPAQPQGYQQPGYPSPQPYQQPGYQQGYAVPPPGYGYPPPQYAEESNAVVALVVSILSIVMCSGLISPFAWWLANKELTGIHEGRRDPTKKDMATAAKVIGMVGSAIFALFVIAFIITILFFGVAIFSTGFDTQ